MKIINIKYYYYYRTNIMALLFDAAHAGHEVIDDRKRAPLIRKLKLLLRQNKNLVVFGISESVKSRFVNSLMKHLEIPSRTLTSDKVIMTKHSN